MKKRAPAKPKLAADRPSAKRGAARPRARRQAERTAADDIGLPSLITVTDEQFQFILDLLEEPPAVSDELRREVANRRWK